MIRIFALLITLSYLTINAQGIEFFQGSFDEVKAEAKKENKIIFMDAYTTWCGPCKRMSKNVFPTKEAGDYFNENFINYKSNMEKGEGKTLAKKYGVRSYPTLLFLDYNGDVVYKTTGARRDARSLIELGKKALKPNKATLKTFQSKWDDGERGIEFLAQFIKIKDAFKEDYNEAFKIYIGKLSAEEKKSEKHLNFIYKYTKNVNSASLDFFKSNGSSLKKYFGKEVYDKKINEIAVESITLAVKEKDESILKQVTSMLKKIKPKDFKHQISYVETKYYGQSKNWKAYDIAVTKYLKKYKKKDDVAHKNVAWNYYLIFDEKAKLEKAENWMQSAIKMNNSYENNLTQSYLLYKLKRYSEAQDAVEYALILSKDSTKRTKNAEILKGKIEQALKGQKKTVVVEYELD